MINAEMDPREMDEQEKAEREEAAAAYSKEDEKHFVDYLQDCVDQSVKARAEVRAKQALCWDVYNEREPASYAEKEPWQARTVVPKPFSAVQFGAASIKKAFSPNFLTIKDEKNPKSADFWQRIMEKQADELHSQFVLNFTDAVVMALAVGESMEMLPKFVPGRGLTFDLVEPWKIHRDPDAPARDPQGGMFWCHQEWLDYWQLLRGEESGRYFDVARVRETSQQPNPDDPFMTEEAIKARKDQVWERSQYRRMILTTEFWGMVLDPKGEVLLPSATYTVAGGRVIQKPEAVRYKGLRWPGVSFSPLPGLLGHGGRGLLEGVISIWDSMNNLMCLHEDAVKWLVLPEIEINVDALVDPEDVERWPGKGYLVRDTPNGQQSIRPVNRRDNTNSVLANMQYYEQIFQAGSFVSDAVQGLPGYRQDMTYREASMNLDNALQVFGLMGSNAEQGAIAALAAARDVVATYAGWDDYLDVMAEEELAEYGVDVDPETGEMILPELTGQFHISGIQALLKDQETLGNLKNTVIPLAGDPRFGKYIRPWRVLKALEERTNLADERVFVDEETGMAMEEQDVQQAAAPPEAADPMAAAMGGGNGGGGGGGPAPPGPTDNAGILPAMARQGGRL